MVDKIIQQIYNETISIVKDRFNNICENLENSYYKYLFEKYSIIMSEFLDEETEDVVKVICASYIDDEKSIWGSLDINQVMSILNKDVAFEHLSFLSNIAFEKAIECKRSGIFFNEENEYHTQLEELTSCFTNVLPFNLDVAKELFSETLLDIEYIFGKSSNMSLRLSKVL